MSTAQYYETLRSWAIYRDTYGVYHTSTNGIKVEADTRAEALKRLKQAYKAHIKVLKTKKL